MSSNELLLATEYLEKEKKIPRAVLIDAIEAALITAYKKNYDSARNVRVELNMDQGTFKVIARKDVVEEVFDDRDEVDLSTALVKNPAYEIGDIYEEDVTPKDFGRVGAQAAKQAVMQRLRDAEREILFEEFIDKEEDILTGIIDRVDHRYVYVNLGLLKLFYLKQKEVLTKNIFLTNVSKYMLTKWNKRQKVLKSMFLVAIQVY